MAASESAALTFECIKIHIAMAINKILIKALFDKNSPVAITRPKS
jgi:hypothetical protein